MNELQIFSNPEFGQVRTLTLSGEPWFVGEDVAEALGYERADNAIRNHVDDEDKLMHQISASGQARDMYVINESGLYALIFGSQLPTAKKFKRWVTSEVLPSIRRTGRFETESKQEQTLDSATLLRCMEIIANSSEETRPYLLSILRQLMPDADAGHPAEAKALSHEGFDVPFDHEKLDKVMATRRLSNCKLGREIGTYGNCVGKWRRGLSSPVTENRNRICDALGLPRGYFDIPFED